jgi:hypothetical protein
MKRKYNMWIFGFCWKGKFKETRYPRNIKDYDTGIILTLIIRA